MNGLRKITAVALLALVWALMAPSSLLADEPLMVNYKSVPIFMANAVKPNIMVLIDNSGSMNQRAYANQAYNPAMTYYGYFEPHKRYQYASNEFTRNATGEWDGNFLNWLTMRRCDVIRKVLVGGKAESRTGVGPQRLVGESNTYDMLFTETGIAPLTGLPPAFLEDFTTGAFAGYWTATSTAAGRIQFGNTDPAYAGSGNYITMDSSVSGTYALNEAVLTVNVSGQEGVKLSFWYKNYKDSSHVLPGDSYLEADPHDYDGVFISVDDGVTWYKVMDLDAPGDSGSPWTQYTVDLDAIKDAHVLEYVGETKIKFQQYDNRLLGDDGFAFDDIRVFSQYFDEAGKPLSKVVVLDSTLTRFCDGTLTPYGDPVPATYYLGLQSGQFFVHNQPDKVIKGGQVYNIKVKKDPAIPDEAHNFTDEGVLAGVFQKVGLDRAYWGLSWFREGSGMNDDGAEIRATPGQFKNEITFLTDVESSLVFDTWTPLAEAYYVLLAYWRMQDRTTLGFDYFDNLYDDTDDPYLRNGNNVECAKSFVILMTDGVSTMDEHVPTSIDGTAIHGIADGTLPAGETRSIDGDSNDDYLGTYTGLFGAADTSLDYTNWDPADATYPEYRGSNFLDDLTFYGAHYDLRDDLDGDQYLYLYTVYALGNPTDPNAAKAVRDLKDASKNGGGLGDDWDKNGDNVPDNFYEAQDGYQLEQKLMDAILDILRRASSGTAVSVLATSAEGEGTLVQAYFKPAVETPTEDVNWVGYLQGLWVDNVGQLREDTPPQGSEPGLDVTHDRIIEFFFDPASGEARFKRFQLDADGNKAYNDDNTNGIKDAGETYIYTEHKLEEMNTIWEAGAKLAQRDPTQRTIYTYLDENNDGVVDVGEFVDFDTTSSSDIKPYLGVLDRTGHVDAHLGATHADRVNNLIRFIRGEDPGASPNGYTGTPNLRFRKIDGNIWKLGDIIHSTPVTIGRPLDNYGLIYGDSSYQNYLFKYRDRVQTVYVGANDGKLHAFLMGKFNPGDNTTTGGVTEEVYLSQESGILIDPADPTAGTLPFPAGLDYGDEMWAYIPQALLPQLKWLATPDYGHVYYVDLKPRIVDVRIFPRTGDDKHPGGWGTVLICGLNFGGKDITVNEDFNGDGDIVDAGDTRVFKSCYFAIDITIPWEPVLLWERTYNNLNFTTVFPTVAKVGSDDTTTPGTVEEKWFVILGSGPTRFDADFDAADTTSGHIYVVDMVTGNLLKDWDTGVAKSFMGSPITVDVGLNYHVDVGFIGQSYKDGSDWRGKLYVFRVPKDAGGDYVTDPVDATDPWTLAPLINTLGPVTAAPAASVDEINNLWVYFGTGRYFNDADKADHSIQYHYGIKDPFYNPALSEAQKAAKTASNLVLLDSTNIAVYTDETISDHPDGIGTWPLFVSNMESSAYDGWYFHLALETGDEGERILVKPVVLGGIVLTPTFIPSTGECAFGGTSNILGAFYKTGTAYPKAVFQDALQEVTVDGQDKTKVLRQVDIGIGKGSSVAVHVGQQEGAKGYIQQSTGIVSELAISPAYNIQSGFIQWRER